MCVFGISFLIFLRGMTMKIYPFLIVLACCALIITGLGIPVNCAGLFYESVSKQLGVGTGKLSVYITVQYAVAGLFLPVAGKLLQKYDSRIVLTFAVITDSLAFGCLGLASTIWEFYLAGIFLGIGSAFLIYLAIPVLITNWFAKKTGLAMGIAFSAAGLASAIASPLITVWISKLGLNYAYGLCGVIMAIISLPFTIFIVRFAPENMGLKPYGFQSKTENYEKKTGLTLKEALGSSSFYFTFIFAGLIGITSAYLFHLPACMTEFGFSKMQAATILSAAVLGITFGKLGIGWLNDALGVEFAAPIGTGIGLIGMIMLFGNFSYYSSLAAGLCYGTGFACTVLEPPPLVKKLFGMLDYSVIYASIMTFSALGCAFGATLIGVTRDYAADYHKALLLLILLQLIAIISFILALMTGRKIMAAT